MTTARQLGARWDELTGTRGEVHDHENNIEHTGKPRRGDRGPLRWPLPGLRKADHGPDAEAVAASNELALSSLWQEGMVNMDPIAVECATCLAVAGEDCNTRFSKRAVSPHVARHRLARVGVGCPRCGAPEREPCLNAAGKVQPRVHTARSNEAWRQRQTRELACAK